MADWRGRQVSENIIDRRNETPLDVVLDTLGLSAFGWNKALFPQPMPPRIELSGGPGPYKGEPLISIETVRGRQTKPGMTLEQARAAPPVGSAATSSFDDMYRRSGGGVFNFSSAPSVPKASKPVSDYWGDFYRSVGIGTPQPAPVAQKPMSVEDIYRGIYGPGPTLASRSVPTVPLNAPLSVSPAGSRAGLGVGMDIPVRIEMARAVQPNQPNGSIVADKSTDRLTAPAYDFDPTAYGYQSTRPAANPATAAIEAAAPRRAPFQSAYAAPARIASMNTGNSGPIQLQFEPGDTSGQRFADSQGKSFRTPSGKVYTPRGGNGAAPVLAGSPQDMRGAPQAKQQGGWASLFSGLLNGNGGTPAPSGAPAIGTSPSQGGAMVVSPGTSTGSTLSSMGFSDGALIPAATIRNLSERKYI